MDTHRDTERCGGCTCHVYKPLGNYSTDTCLTHLLDYIKTNSSQGLYTGMVLLDLQKAFDTVDHQILVNKLKNMGIGSVEWFSSYLSCRQQIVEIDSVKSDPRNITCGVPQGSILGPLLFLCYVNDMEISLGCKLMLYADDSVLLVSHKDPDHISNTLSHELESCNKWLVDNKLSLHLGKTEAILFGSKRKLNKVKSFHVKCNDNIIKSSPVVKYLGLNIDQTTSGSEIVNGIIKKVNGKIKFLYRQAKFLNFKTQKLLCNSLVQPNFDYACSSWYSGLTIKHKNQLQVLQNKMVRFLLNLDPRSHIGSIELAEVGMLNVEQRVNQLKLNHIFKIFNNTSPSYLSQNFTRVSSFHNYSTRSSNYNFVVPRVQGIGTNTFYYSAIKLWNDMPNNIKCQQYKCSFKMSVKKYFLDKATNDENIYIYY